MSLFSRFNHFKAINSAIFLSPTINGYFLTVKSHLEEDRHKLFGAFEFQTFQVQRNNIQQLYRVRLKSKKLELTTIPLHTLIHFIHIMLREISRQSTKKISNLHHLIKLQKHSLWCFNDPFQHLSSMQFHRYHMLSNYIPTECREKDIPEVLEEAQELIT